MGDFISIKKGDEGYVEDINYLNTIIRKTDESIVTVPNHVFTQGEVVNWSRTPYRKFSTATSIPVGLSASLPRVMATIKNGLLSIPQVEKESRELTVAATSVDDGKIAIKVDVYFLASNDLELAEIASRAVSIIADAVNSIG